MNNSEWLTQLAKEAPDELAEWFDAEHREPPECDLLDELKADIDAWRELHAQVMSERNHAIAERDELKRKEKQLGNELGLRDRAIELLQDVKHELIEERDKWKAKAEAKSAKRAAAAERLWNRELHQDSFGDDIIDALVGSRYGMSALDTVKTICDLLSDDELPVPSSSPNGTSNGTSNGTANGTCPDVMGQASNDARENLRSNLGSELSTLEVFEGEGSKVDSREKHVSMPYHNGEKQAKLLGKQADQMIFDELHDSREKLEAELDSIISDALRNLRRAIYQCVEQRMDVLSFSDGEFIDFEHEEFVGEYVERAMKVLDRQAAITERELCKQCEWPSLAAQPDQEAYDRIAELTAKVDEQFEIIAARGKTIESLEKFMSERKLKLKKQLESKNEQCRKLKAERDEYRELYEAAMSADYGQLLKECESYRAEISEMLDAAQQIERIRAKHETQSN